MSEQHKEHILPIKAYLGVAGALFILTMVTVAVSYINLGGWNAVVAVSIASFKVSLVALFFMHLKYDNKINLFIFLIGISFVTLFIIFTMFDTLRRADIYEIKAKPIKEKAHIYERAPDDSTQQSDAAQH
ncbi:hypothetical protein EH223_18515 [candidate division KSB1 bacterium]|nr:cytochrome C oxidase subunit IV family protein [candidate division KSB1 bacterium]RQW00479.1 MAG: hypothetical protein EH223_18515 [candidate division KSB1 bacterium]